MKNETIPTSQFPSVPPEKQGFFRGFLAWLPVIQWVLTLAIGAVVCGVSFRDSQSVQALDVRENARKIASLEVTVENNKADREKKLDEIKRTILTKEVFDAYHSNDVARMDRIEKGIEQLLMNQSR